MSGCPFIGSEGEQGGRASEGNRRWQWCTIMVADAAVSGGYRPGWWWGVMRGGAPTVTGVEGAPGGGARMHARRCQWLQPSVRGGR
jgi:hypothetical protein